MVPQAWSIMPLFFNDREACVAFCEQRGWTLGPWRLEPVLASTDLAWNGTCTRWIIRLIFNDGRGNSELQGWFTRL
jgi:hypothetical protein